MTANFANHQIYIRLSFNELTFIMKNKLSSIRIAFCSIVTISLVSLKKSYLKISQANLILLFVFLFSLTASGQSQPQITQGLEVTHAGLSQDQSYMLFSKGIYETGEDMWFKAWLFDRSLLTLSNRSRTLFLRIYDPADSLVWNEKYPIYGGRTEGHVFIGEKWKTGEYRVEGYTQSSFYADSTEAIFPQKIWVVDRIDKQKPQDTRAGQQRDNIRLGLYPEGGYLVQGIKNHVAFKTTDNQGMPAPMSGWLCENGTRILDIESCHDGMGQFPLVPHEGGRYTIQLNSGQEFPLPASLRSGMVIHLERTDKRNVVFSVRQPKGSMPRRITLFVQMRNVPCCRAKGILRDSLIITLPTSEFIGQGIAEATLYDEQQRPVAERLFYVLPDKQLAITARPSKEVYSRRDKGKVRIHVTDSEGKPVQAEICVSIFDKAYMNQSYRETMLSYNLLSTQIRGNIHHPAYYFDRNNPDRLYALDLLLLTQGWRRYTWQASRKDYHGKPFLCDSIIGRESVGSRKMKRNATNGGEQVIQVFGPSGDSQFLWTDSVGNFSVPVSVMNMLRGGYVYIKPLLGKEFKPHLAISDGIVLIDSIRKSKNSYLSYSMNNIDKEKKDVDPIMTQAGTVLLNEVLVTRKRRMPFRDKFMGRLDSLAQFNLNTAWVCADGPQEPGTIGHLNDYREGYTHHPAGSPGANYRGKRLKPEIGKRYELIKYLPREDGEWYLADITSIVYQGQLYTDEELLRMNNIARVKGYYGQREFYTPDSLEMLSPLPDARNTLLWSPSVQTDKNGDAIMPFWTSDINTQFIGVVEGTDGLGLLGSGIFEFHVSKNKEE